MLILFFCSSTFAPILLDREFVWSKSYYNFFIFLYNDCIFSKLMSLLTVAYIRLSSSNLYLICLIMVYSSSWFRKKLRFYTFSFRGFLLEQWLLLSNHKLYHWWNFELKNPYLFIYSNLREKYNLFFELNIALGVFI